MTCPSCSTANPAGAAFCMSCGEALTASCASCDADLPGGAAFCPTCGTPVAEAAETDDGGLKKFIPSELMAKLEYAASAGGMEGERRTVTMLFCDVQGSTAAAEKMDPEEWADVMNGAFEHLIAPVYKYEGTLARLMGDAILAFFGAPIGHEDDPERAVLAGLEILEAIEPYKAQVKREWGLDIDVRVGINTGLVVVGAVGSDLRVEYTAMGDAVNTAARMESTAAPGTIQITDDTKQLVERLFEFEDLGGIEVKGKDEPVQTWRVVKALPRPETLRGIEGLASPLVGRDEDLQRVLDVIAGMKSGNGGIVSLVAEAGLGKSRLVSEVAAAVEADGAIAWHEGRSLSYETATPYAPVRRLVASLCGLEGGESPAESWRRIDAEVGRVAPGKTGSIAPYLAWLLGVPVPEEDRHRVEYLDPPQLRVEAFRAVRELVEAEAADGELVIVFEDLHWADEASLELVTELLATAAAHRVVLVLLLRPRRQEGSWTVHETASRDFPHVYTSVELQPLTDEQTRELIANLLAVDNLPETVRAEVLAKADGNPFFIEEILRWLIDRESVVHTGSAWTAVEAIADIQVPDTLAAVLTTRLDALDEGARRIAQAASVVGRDFRYDELTASLPDLSGLDDGLLDLQRRDLIEEVARIPKRRYRFRHALLQDATYGTVLLKQRVRLHAAVAEFLERTQPERVEDLADHLMRAREPMRALPYLVAAGERAAAAYAVPLAISRFETALETIDESTDARLVQRALEGLGTSRQFQFDLEGAAAAYQQLLDEGDRRDDVPMRVSGLNKLGLVQAFFFDERDTGLANLASSEAMAREAGIADGLIEACINQCYVRTGHAEFDEVAYYMGEVTRLGTEAGAAEPTLFGMVHHANTLCYLTQFDAALELGEKALAKAEELGNLRFQAELLTFTIPMCHLRNGDVPAATAAVERGMALATQIGSYGSEAFAAVLQGKLAMEQGYLEDALALFRRVMTAGGATGVPYIIALGKCVTGTCFLHIGGSFVEQARALHQEALDVMEQPTGMTLGAWMWTEIGQCQLATGEVEDARELFEKALTEKTAPMYLQRPGALAGSIQVALIDGDLATAREHLDDLEAYVTERSMQDQMMLLMLMKSAVAGGEGDHESALSTLDELVEAAEGAGMRRMLMDAHMTRVSTLVAAGRSEDADLARSAARAVGESIAADIGDGELRSEFESGLAARLAG